MWGNFTGLFGSLKGASRTRVEEGRVDSVRQVWQEGEVHAELIRVRCLNVSCRRRSRIEQLALHRMIWATSSSATF